MGRVQGRRPAAAPRAGWELISGDHKRLMNTPSADSYVLPRWMRAWEQFWFTPADPTLLALMRISCGMLLVYTLLVYSFSLQEFMGEYGWHDLQLQRERIEERPVQNIPLDWDQ